MKNLFAFCLLNSFTTIMTAQPTIEWQKAYGGSSDDYAMSMQLTSDGGYVMVGNCSSKNGDVIGHHGSTDLWVVKVNDTGNIQWSRALGGSDDESQPLIQQTADGGFILLGKARSSNGDVSGHHGISDFWVVKLNLAGNIEWGKTLGGSSYDTPFALLKTSDGGYVVAGNTLSNNGDALGNHGDADFFVAKLSNVGLTQWVKVLGGTNYEALKSIIQTTDGGYVVAGETESDDGQVSGLHGAADFWVLKLTSTGVLEWEKALGGSIDESLGSIIQTSDGGYITVGRTFSNDGDVTGNHGKSDCWVVKLTTVGTLEWQKTFGGSEIDEAYSIQEADDEGFIIGGRTYSINGDVTGNHGGSLNQDYWLVKINDAGALLWERALGGNSGDNIYSIKTLNDGGYVLAGDSYSSDGDIPGNHGYTDAWVLRLNSVGEVLWKKSMGGNAYDGSYHVEPTADGGYIVGARASSYDGDVTGQHGAGDYWLIKLSPEMVGVENNAYLNQAKYLEVFPNPSTDEVFIKLSSEEPSINVQISNLLGQQLSQQTIPNGGSLDISKLPNGIYCVLVTTPTGKVFSSKFTKQE